MKKILLSLFVGFVGIISFCSADLFESSTSTYNVAGSYVWNNTLNYNWSLYKGYRCVLLSDAGIRCNVNGNNVYGGQSYTFPSSICVYNDVFNISCYSTDGNDHNFYVTRIGGVSCPVCPECPTCDPQYTSEQCQSVYGLVSSGLLDTCENNYNNCQSDLNSCQSNTSGFNDQLNNCNLSLNACNSSLTNCLQYNCPETELFYSKFYVKHGSNNWFNLTGTENYYVYLPDFLGYNFEYSNGTDLDFTVGVATDTGYINNINAIQNSKPSQEDLNKLVSEVLPLFIPGLAVILLLYFIFRFIKKIF